MVSVRFPFFTIFAIVLATLSQANGAADEVIYQLKPGQKVVSCEDVGVVGFEEATCISETLVIKSSSPLQLSQGQKVVPCEDDESEDVICISSITIVSGEKVIPYKDDQAVEQPQNAQDSDSTSTATVLSSSLPCLLLFQLALYLI